MSKNGDPVVVVARLSSSGMTMEDIEEVYLCGLSDTQRKEYEIELARIYSHLFPNGVKEFDLSGEIA